MVQYSVKMFISANILSSISPKERLVGKVPIFLIDTPLTNLHFKIDSIEIFMKKEKITKYKLFYFLEIEKQLVKSHLLLNKYEVLVGVHSDQFNGFSFHFNKPFKNSFSTLNDFLIEDLSKITYALSLLHDGILYSPIPPILGIEIIPYLNQNIKIKLVDDKCHICLNDYSKTYKLCCTQLCADCLKLDNYGNKCFCCKQPFNIS